MDLNKANLNNLTCLWKRYGVSSILHKGEYQYYLNNSWPFRTWFEPLTENFIQGTLDETWLSTLPASTVLPICQNTKHTKQVEQAVCEIEASLLSHHWQISFRQTAMYLPLSNKAKSGNAKSAKAKSQATFNSEFEIEQVSHADDLKLWVEVASEAFNYQVDETVIQGLIGAEDVQILLVKHRGQAVATALMLKTAEVVGVHQVGVHPSAQGQGIAKNLMLALIQLSGDWGGQYMVLQASELGLPLYQNLGFISQFTISNYQQATTL